MKNIILTTIALLSFTFSNAQREPIDILTYEQTQDINFFRDVRNNTPVKEYILSDKNSIKVGDTLIIGSPTSSVSSSNYNTVTRNVNTSTNAAFQFVKLGRPAGLGAIMSAAGGDFDANKLTSGYSGDMVVIEEMKTSHNGGRKKPLLMILVLGELNGGAFGVNKYISTMDFELAYINGELSLKNRMMTRDEAIAKLKEAKDLFDLDLMTEEEYSKIRDELAPLIRGNN
jgi:hypothetical protein